MKRLLQPTTWKRTAFYVTGDVAVAAGAALLVELFLHDTLGVSIGSQKLLLAGLALILIQILVNMGLSVYSIKWSTFSVGDVPRSCAAGLAGGLALIGMSSLGMFHSTYLSAIAIWTIVDVVGGLAVRSSRRFYDEAARRGHGKRTVVVVSSDRCYFILDTLRRTVGEDYNVLGFIDSNPANRGILSQGVPVLGTTADILKVIRDYRIESVLILLSADQSLALSELYGRLRQVPEVEVKMMPSLVDMIEDRANTMALERRAIHELTGRPPVAIDVRELQMVFGGKPVMVTGAGGSIGAELCRQLARLAPAKLILFERDDSNLFYVERELRGLHPALSLMPFLGDVTCEKDVLRVFDEHRPAIVFHAAAYKHVPILEFHPDEAIRVNVLGTHLLARTAVKHGTESFVYISTDKAVNPSSVMGASKRLGEMAVTSMNGLGDVRFLAVRFGNVLDSRGSVSTLFRSAIRERRAITITDPEMKRYFMLTSEAVLLVMQSVALGRGGEVFVLDMGNPVNVKDLALAMIRHAGLQPDVDIPIVVTGRRPGEKLFEELFTAEEGTIATSNKNIWRARISRSYCYPDILEDLRMLESVIESSDPSAVRSEIFRLVQNYKPDPSALKMAPTACGASLGLAPHELAEPAGVGRDSR